MNHDLEKQMRDALRPVEANGDLTTRVLARIREEKAATERSRLARRSGWIPASLAASLVLALVGHHQWQEHREQQALKAKQQLMEALRVTSAKLDIAYQAVRNTDQES
jgi:hypothetical protein